MRDQSGFEPVGEWIGFSHCLSADTAGDYLVGLSGPARIRLVVNGQDVFERTDDEVGTAGYWHIVRISLLSGLNIVEILGSNSGGIVALGAEISGPFAHGSLENEAEQKSADYAGNLILVRPRESVLLSNWEKKADMPAEDLAWLSTLARTGRAARPSSESNVTDHRSAVMTASISKLMHAYLTDAFVPTGLARAQPAMYTRQLIALVVMRGTDLKTGAALQTTVRAKMARLIHRTAVLKTVKPYASSATLATT